MKVEIRGATEAVIEGYVNAVGRESRMLPSHKGPFFEIVKPGTFTKALSRAKSVELRFNHSKVLGSTDDELRLYEDNIGLYAKATVRDADIIQKAKDGKLKGWSFGFSTIKDEWRDIDGIQRRYLEDISLSEVSILDKMPAYIATSIEARDSENIIIELRCLDDEIEVTDNSVEVRNEPVVLDQYKYQIEILKLKGGM